MTVVIASAAPSPVPKPSSILLWHSNGVAFPLVTPYEPLSTNFKQVSTIFSSKFEMKFKNIFVEESFTALLEDAAFEDVVEGAAGSSLTSEMSNFIPSASSSIPGGAVSCADSVEGAAAEVVDVVDVVDMVDVAAADWTAAAAAGISSPAPDASAAKRALSLSALLASLCATLSAITAGLGAGCVMT